MLKRPEQNEFHDEYGNLDTSLYNSAIQTHLSDLEQEAKARQEAIDAWIADISSHPNLWASKEDKALIALGSPTVVKKWKLDPEYEGWSDEDDA